MRGIATESSAGSSGVFRSALAVALIGAVACTSASGEVKGGDPRPGYDAAAPAPLEVAVTEDPYTNAAPTTWKGIYRDFFGRRAQSSCAGNGTCHDAPDRPGSKISNFVCADLDGCYESLRTAKDPDPRVSMHALVEVTDLAAPEGAYLFKVIRYRTKDGQVAENRGMPQLPRDFAFKSDEIDRMQAWIRSGAKND
jgi:hypothetical protein